MKIIELIEFLRHYEDDVDIEFSASSEGFNVKIPQGTNKLKYPTTDIVETIDELQSIVKDIEKHQNHYNDCKTYKYVMFPMLYTDENIEKLQNYDEFVNFYKDFTMTPDDDIVIPKLFTELQRLKDCNITKDIVEFITIGKHSNINVVIGVNGVDNVDVIIKIYQKFFNQFQCVKNFTFDKNKELGYITIDEEF